MRKILGILLVLSSSTAMGLDCLRKKRLRIRKLKEMAAMLDAMEREIRERRTPLSRLMQKLALGQGGRKKDYAVKVYETMQQDGVLFSEAWKCGLASDAQACLVEEAGEELTELGEILGRFSAERQCEALDRVSGYLKERADELADELHRSAKITLGGSLSAGAVMVLLLI